MEIYKLVGFTNINVKGKDKFPHKVVCVEIDSCCLQKYEDMLLNFKIERGQNVSYVDR